MKTIKKLNPAYLELAKIFSERQKNKEIINSLSMRITINLETGNKENCENYRSIKNDYNNKNRELLLNPKIPKLIKKASDKANLLPQEHQENLKLFQLALFQDNATSCDAYYYKLSDALKQTHMKHKKDGDFSKISDMFSQKVIKLRERMSFYKDAYNNQINVSKGDHVTSLYDAMLRKKERDAREESVGFTMDTLRKELPHSLNKIRQNQQAQNVIKIDRSVSKDKKFEMVKEILAIVSPEDFQKTDFFSSKGSSCSNTINNSIIRINTSTQSPVKAITSGLHEFGHANYFMNSAQLDDLGAYKMQPIAYKRGGTMSEGSAYALQNIITTKEFWTFASPIVQKYYGVESSDSDAEAFSAENLYKIATQVDTQNIGNRLAADKLSMHMHIVMRDKLEKELIEGEINPEKFDQVWQEYSDAILGVVSDKPEDNCMQDVHFYKYPLFYGFAFYSTGLIYGENALRLTLDQDPSMLKKIEKGDFSTLMDTYKEKFFSHGARYKAEDVLHMAGGDKSLDVSGYLKSVEKNYSWAPI